MNLEEESSDNDEFSKRAARGAAGGAAWRAELMVRKRVDRMRPAETQEIAGELSRFFRLSALPYMYRIVSISLARLVSEGYSDI